MATRAEIAVTADRLLAASYRLPTDYRLPTSSQRFHHPLDLLIRFRKAAFGSDDVVGAAHFFVDGELCGEALAGFPFARASAFRHTTALV